MKFLYPTEVTYSNVKAKNRLYCRLLTDRLWKLLLIFVFLFAMYSWINIRWAGKYVANLKPRCLTPKEELDDLKYMAIQTRAVLEKHNITYSLGYGSIWGAMRVNDILPWDDDIDLWGVLDRNADKMSIVNSILADMKAAGMDVHFRKWQGIIQTYSHYWPHNKVDIMFWCDYYGTGTMHRCPSIESWFFFVHHRLTFIFPASFLKAPLPTLQFMNESWPVPREGIEIMKIHYPHDWWKVAKPPGCS